jgi:hypothetical protein
MIIIPDLPPWQWNMGTSGFVFFQMVLHSDDFAYLRAFCWWLGIMDNYQGKIEDDGKEEIIGENSGKIQPLQLNYLIC